MIVVLLQQLIVPSNNSLPLLTASSKQLFSFDS
jgi:hypothetical protein